MRYHNPTVCNIDELIRVSPLAIIAIVSLSFDMLKISSALPFQAYRGIITYVGGLLALDKKQTAHKIAKYLGGLSHDHLTRLLADQQWHCSLLIRVFLQILTTLGISGYLIIDDTLIPHSRSKKMDAVYWDWDHALQRNVFGQRLVLLLWSNGYWRIPVGFSFWHKQGARPKYRTKNEIARTLLRWAIHNGVKPEFVTFDNWYASAENMNFIVHELKLSFVTRLKKNCRLMYQGKKLQARTIGRRLLQQKRTYRSTILDNTWSRKAEVQVGTIGLMTFCVVKDDLDGEQTGCKYLLASTPRLSARTVVLRYKRRWIIEVYFRDLKQHVGLTHYQGRGLAGTERHVVLTFLAVLVVDYFRCGTTYSFEETRNLLQRVVFIRDRKQQLHLATIVPIPENSLNDIDQAKGIVRTQLNQVSPFKLQEVDKLAA
jgi:SRSO17 transposase